MTESQSWVTAKAQEMFQKTGNWSPDRPYPDDFNDNRNNPQVWRAQRIYLFGWVLRLFFIMEQLPVSSSFSKLFL